MKKLANRKLSMFTLALCLTSLNSVAQTSRQGEALSARVSHLRNLVEHTTEVIEQRVQDLMDELGEIKIELNQIDSLLGAAETSTTTLTDLKTELATQTKHRKNCFDQKNKGSIYWPTHANAGKDGCLPHSKLWTIPK